MNRTRFIGSVSGSKSVSVNVIGSRRGSSDLSLNLGSSGTKTSSNTGTDEDDLHLF